MLHGNCSNMSLKNALKTLPPPIRFFVYSQLSCDHVW